ncbi:MAG: response regulator [Verrucomicrobiae bacterium]|nr:response regulator [Verrucomicrobiae bacterium]
MSKMAGKGRGRVLVVDDDPMAVKLLKVGLEREGYTVLGAMGGEEAKGIVQKEGVRSLQCAVIDYRMPVMSGFEFLVWLQTQDASLAAIMVTAESEKSLVEKSLRGGAHDFLEKPIDFRQLLPSVAMAVEKTSRRRYLDETANSAEQLGYVQYSMAQAQTPDDRRRVKICFHPCHQAGGDFVNVFQLDLNRTLVMVADVSGHDLKAAFIGAYFQGVVRGMVHKETPVDEILTFFNDLLLSEWNSRRNEKDGVVEVNTSVSVCSVLFDWQARSLSLINHGLPGPLMIDKLGRGQLVGEQGSPLGWFESRWMSECRMSIGQGGEFLAWTDGLEELAIKQNLNPCSVAYRLLKAVGQKERQVLLEGAEDDILVVRVQLNEKEGEYQTVFWNRYPGDHVVRIDELQAIWERCLIYALEDLDLQRLDDVLLCMREAALNAMEYGCKGRETELFTMEMGVLPEQNILRVRVSDPGAGFNLEPPTSKPGEDDQHLGLMLIRSLSRARVEPGTSSIVMDFVLK